MTRSFISRLQILAAVLAALALLAVAGLVTPASAEAASQGRCSVTRDRRRRPGELPHDVRRGAADVDRTLGTAIPRGGKTCTIAHSGRSTPRRSASPADAAAAAKGSGGVEGPAPAGPSHDRTPKPEKGIGDPRTPVHKTTRGRLNGRPRPSRAVLDHARSEVTSIGQQLGRSGLRNDRFSRRTTRRGPRRSGSRRTRGLG